MRPSILNPLFAPVDALPGLGPRLAKLMQALAGPLVLDVLWHRPSGVIDRRFRPSVADAPDGRVATLTLTIADHVPPRAPRAPHRIRCHDDTGPIDIVMFHARGDRLMQIFPAGAQRVVSGRVEVWQGRKQIAHPDHVAPPEGLADVAVVEPVYPLAAGLVPKVVAKAAHAAVERAPVLPEWIDATLRDRHGWPTWRDAIVHLHAPQAEDDLAPEAPHRARLAYDELLAGQLALLMIRTHARRQSGRSVAGDARLQARVRAALPFSLTGAQERSLTEITADMAAPDRMLRLLQGDVGSGKTVVALLAMLAAIEAGAQAAMMAPTEILARQHAETMAPLADAAGVRLAVLTGRDKGRAREEILIGLATGRIPLVVGTHALIQQDVQFRDLAMVVFDEQHRFGVDQRLALSGKGRAVDILAMTATPIPRTLSLTLYGDMDGSRLDEKPPGRKPIDTRVLPLDRLGDVVARLRAAVAEGAQVYWVCPLVEESETSDMAAAEARAAELARIPGLSVGLVHGRLKAAEKDRTVADFSAGRTAVLVATTVIEVGVNVPNASIMVIEHAERFGLAQLHQLRGRVGRGTRQSSCLLLYASPLTDAARARLAILRETEDGFRIAEEDLRLRGAGEVLGTRQSGLPGYRIADLEAHGDLVAVARADALLALERDPDLASDRGRALRTLLYLFQQDQAVRTLRSG